MISLPWTSEIYPHTSNSTQNHTKDPRHAPLPQMLLLLLSLPGGLDSIAVDGRWPPAINTHWGQGVNYPVGPCWVHGGFWNNSPDFYPVGKGWVFFKSTHQSTHWVTLWKNPVGSLRTLFEKCPSCAWATHCGFFQKVPINLTTIYPTIYPVGSLRVCRKIEPNWGFYLITLK